MIVFWPPGRKLAKFSFECQTKFEFSVFKKCILKNQVFTKLVVFQQGLHKRWFRGVKQLVSGCFCHKLRMHVLDRLVASCFCCVFSTRFLTQAGAKRYTPEHLWLAAQNESLGILEWRATEVSELNSTQQCLKRPWVRKCETKNLKFEKQKYNICLFRNFHWSFRRSA